MKDTITSYQTLLEMIAAPAWVEDEQSGGVLGVNEPALNAWKCSREEFLNRGVEIVRSKLDSTNGRLYSQVRIPLSKPRGASEPEFVLVVEQKGIAAPTPVSVGNVSCEMALGFVCAGVVDYHIDADEAVMDRRASELFGLDPDHNYHIAEVSRRVHPSDLGPSWQQMSESLKDEAGVSDLEYRAFKANGESSWVRGFARVTQRDAAGNARVLTQLVRGADCCHNAELLNRSFSIWPEAIVIIEGFAVARANPAALRLFGVSDEPELLGKNGLQLFSPAHREIVGAVAERLLRSNGVGETGRLRILQLDKQEVEVDFEAFGFAGHGKDQIHVVFRKPADAAVWNSVII